MCKLENEGGKGADESGPCRRGRRRGRGRLARRDLGTDALTTGVGDADDCACRYACSDRCRPAHALFESLPPLSLLGLAIIGFLSVGAYVVSDNYFAPSMQAGRETRMRRRMFFPFPRPWTWIVKVKVEMQQAGRT